MKIVALSDLYGLDFNLSKVFALSQRWNDGDVFSTIKNSRQTSALLYLKDCDVHYIFDDNSVLDAKKGSLVYIPQGSRYECVFYGRDKNYGITQLVEFEMTSSDAPFSLGEKAFLAAQNESKFYSEMFDRAVNLNNAPIVSFCALKSVIFNMLYSLSKGYRKMEFMSPKFKVLAPAIEYLDKNYMSNDSISFLSRLCNVSETYFRRQFKEYTGMTPLDYCHKIKIDNACRILESGLYSVSQTAMMLGFEDASYFTKFFKKNVGVSPRQFMLQK